MKYVSNILCATVVLGFLAFPDSDARAQTNYSTAWTIPIDAALVNRLYQSGELANYLANKTNLVAHMNDRFPPSDPRFSNVIVQVQIKIRVGFLTEAHALNVVYERSHNMTWYEAIRNGPGSTPLGRTNFSGGGDFGFGTSFSMYGGSGGHVYLGYLGSYNYGGSSGSGYYCWPDHEGIVCAPLQTEPTFSPF